MFFNIPQKGKKYILSSDFNCRNGRIFIQNKT